MTERAAHPGLGETWLTPSMHRRLAAFARRFVGDAGEAEDLAQETLMRAGGAVHRLRRPGREEAWLFRICRHAAIDHVRMRRVRREVWGAFPEDGLAQAPARPETPPARAGLLPEAAGALLRELPAHHRLLLGLHYEKGVSQPVLCRMTGLSPSAMRVRLFRARQRLLASELDLPRPRIKDDPGGGR